jgi:hypothetical protein
LQVIDRSTFALEASLWAHWCSTQWTDSSFALE